MKNSTTENFTHGIAKPMLCDGFLIPMTDFVLRINEIEKEIDQFFDSWRMNQLRIIENYAKFLKQPLKLEMFVPCDDEGIVLEEYVDEHTTQIFAQYQYDLDKAKEKILFEGFEPYEDYECAKYEEVYVDEEVCDGKFTVEDLIKDAGKTKNKLSQTSLNAIFGYVMCRFLFIN